MNKPHELKQQVKINRLRWVDIFKGGVMLLVIIGHTAPFGSLTRNIIFSFHMPIFFILSGFCTHMVSSGQEMKSFISKHFSKLIIPVLLLSLIFMGVAFIQSGLDVSQIQRIVKVGIDKLAWASGVKVKNHPALGMPWFLVSLFTASIIFQYLFLKIKDEKCLLYSVGLISFTGVYLGVSHHWLPLNLDVSLVCVFFIYVGYLWKKYNRWFEKYDSWIFLGALGLWLYWLGGGNYIELATRRYPGFSLAFAEAIAGSVVMYGLARIIEKGKVPTKILSFIGRHTFILFNIHCIDGYWMFLWKSHNWVTASVKRVVIDLIIFGIIVTGEMLFQKYKNRN